MGETYADRWNREAAQRGVSLPTGPQLVVLSGEWDMNAETSELMDYEISLPEAVAAALGEMRASTSFRVEQDDPGVFEMMEVDYGAWRTSHITIIPDTNVMISYLPLIDSLTRFLSACPDLSMSILIPGIVMSELDGLRKSAGRTCQIQAQDANRWAASELQKRAVVRGQRDYATTAPGGSWRRHYYATGKENPDGYILDCVFFEQQQSQEGRWIVLTLDQNCAAQCLSNGIHVIKPEKSWTLNTLVGEAVKDTPVRIQPAHQSVLATIAAGQSNSSMPPHTKRSVSGAPLGAGRKQASVDWANAPNTKPRPSYRVAHSSPPSLPPGPHLPFNTPHDMEVDDHNLPPRIPTPPPPRDARDDLQEQLLALLQTIIPSLCEKSIESHNRPKVDSNVSIHAKPLPRRASGRATKRTLPATSSTEWKNWPIHDQIQFLAEYPPPAPEAQGNTPKPATRVPPVSYSEAQQSAILSLAALARKDRRGREFGRGDWERACTGLGTLWPPMKDAFAQAVKEAFES